MNCPVELIALAWAALPGDKPVAVPLTFFVCIISRLHEGPFDGSAAGSKTNLGSKQRRSHYDPFQRIPPKLTAAADISGRHKERCGHLVLLEQRSGIMKIVGITIIKCHDDSA